MCTPRPLAFQAGSPALAPVPSAPPTRSRSMSSLRRGEWTSSRSPTTTRSTAPSLAHLPDTFISEELTASFKGEPQAVHVLCYGITPEDHEWLQAHADTSRLRGLPAEHGITAALAHPFRRRRAARAASPPAPGRAVPDLGDAQWLPRQGTEPAGVRLHRDARRHRDRRLRRPRRNRHRPHLHRDAPSPRRGGVPCPDPRRQAAAHGTQGSAAKWTHAAMALAIRALGDGEAQDRPDPRAVLKIVERVMSEGDVRTGSGGRTSRPRMRSPCCAPGWSMELDVDERKLLPATPGRRA